MKITAVILALFLSVTLGCGGAESPPVETLQTVTVLENGSFSTEIDGRTIHYEIHGSGPVLMTLANSWGLSLEGIRGLFGPLEERLTMVYFDPRGMGESSPVAADTDMGLAAVRGDFHALRRHLGLDTVNAIGWSNGATNLILLAAGHPGTIDNAIFVHGAASYGPDDFMAFAHQYPELTRMYITFQQEMADENTSDEAKTSRMREVWLGEYFPAITADPDTAGPLIQTTFADAEFSWPHSKYATRESPAFDFREDLGAITTRCLVIAGAHDSLTPDKVREISDGIADATFLVFENSGHFAPLEEPGRFTTEIFEFLGVK